MKNIAITIVSRFIPLFFLLGQAAQASDLSIVISAHKDRSTEGVVVELVSKRDRSATPTTIEIDQKGQEFIPLISIAPVGSTLIFNNLDDLKHHVYSTSRGNQFDLPLHDGSAPKEITLEKPGVVKLGCNIHDWMLAYVYVSESDRVQIMDDSGKVNFADVPAGDYEIRIWSPRLRNTKQALIESITIGDDESIDHQMSIKLRKHIRKPQRHDNDLYYGS